MWGERVSQGKCVRPQLAAQVERFERDGAAAEAAAPGGEPAAEPPASDEPAIAAGEPPAH